MRSLGQNPVEFTDSNSDTLTQFNMQLEHVGPDRIQDSQSVHSVIPYL